LEALKGKDRVEQSLKGKSIHACTSSKKTIDLLKSKGATIIEIDYLDEIKLGEDEFEVMQFEFKAGEQLLKFF
jgi:hypothetical protein